MNFLLQKSHFEISEENEHSYKQLRLCHTGAIFTTNSPKYPKSTKNPIAQWSFQRNRYSSTCTAKSLFAVNRGFNYGSDRHSGVYY